MVLSYLLLKYPYKLAWNALNIIKERKQSVFYAEDYLDMVVFKSVQKYLAELPIVAKNKVVANSFQPAYNPMKIYPVYPKAIITCRHVCHKFPEKRIVKFGMRHGAYHFKRLTNANNYNAFTKYFMTSQHEVDIAKKIGINTAVAVGYPKLDPAFNGEISQQDLSILSNHLGFSNNKKSVLFTATWDKSGMSAIDAWIDKLDSLTEAFNVMVTVHPWTSTHYKKKLIESQNIHFLSTSDTLAYLMLADCVVGDTSSILAEACALDKPIITYETKETKRSLDEISDLIKSISYQIDPSQDILNYLNFAIENKDEFRDNRQKANIIMFDKLDGKAGERAAKIILEDLYLN